MPIEMTAHYPEPDVAYWSYEFGPPDRGWRWFGQWRVDSQFGMGSKAGLVRMGLERVDVEPDSLTDWYARYRLPTFPLLLFWYGARKRWYRDVLKFLWRWGFIDISRSRIFSWRRDFRPTPWKGRRRVR